MFGLMVFVLPNPLSSMHGMLSLVIAFGALEHPRILVHTKEVRFVTPPPTTLPLSQPKPGSPPTPL